MVPEYGVHSKMSKAIRKVTEPDEHMHSLTSYHVILLMNVYKQKFIAVKRYTTIGLGQTN